MVAVEHYGSLAVRFLVESVSEGWWVTHKNGDGLEEKAERVSGKEIRGPWVSTRGERQVGGVAPADWPR